MKNWLKNNWQIAIIFLFTLVVRFWHLSQPPNYYFDEVYTAFTAQAYAKNDPAGYEWWNPVPAGFAYGWTHPPLGKLIGAAGILLFGDNTFGWRFFPALFGSAFTLLFYYVGLSLFNKRVGVLAATLYSLETLFLAQSRILLYDIFLAFFILTAFFLAFLFLKNSKANLKLLIATGVVFGLAAANKTVGFWGLAAVSGLFLFYFLGKQKIWQALFYPITLGVIALSLYLLTFTQFFLQGHTFIYLSDIQAFFHNLTNEDEKFFKGQFAELHNQIWRYETGLKATHPFSSSWFEWITARGAIWYWTNQQGDTAANIWAVGNPVIFILGAVSIGFLIFRFAEARELKFGIILLGYFSLLLPWILVPRLVFLYHYLPSLSFLILTLAVFLDEIWQKEKIGQFLVGVIFIVALAIFIYIFPHATGIYLPEEQAKTFNDLILKLR